MRTRYALAFITSLAALAAEAQYCSPTFANGCFSWQNQSINIGTIAWTQADCSVSDQTAMSTVVDPGTAVSMTVVSGNWCGCAVWVDFNDDQVFADEENLYYTYVGGDPSYTYTFDLSIPAAAVAGPHRMRVIAPWGSDGVTPGDNGYGPCGSFQYGNFDDFTLIVSGTTGVKEVAPVLATLATANPTDGRVLLNVQAFPLDRILVRSMDGRLLMDRSVGHRQGQVEVDLGGLSAGAYLLECCAGERASTLRVVKQ